MQRLALEGVAAWPAFSHRCFYTVLSAVLMLACFLHRPSNVHSADAQCTQQAYK